MVIIYSDGSKLECSKVEFYGSTVYADDCYIVPMCDVDCIVDDESDAV